MARVIKPAGKEKRSKEPDIVDEAREARERQRETAGKKSLESDIPRSKQRFVRVGRKPRELDVAALAREQREDPERRAKIDKELKKIHGRVTGRGGARGFKDIKMTGDPGLDFARNFLRGARRDLEPGDPELAAAEEQFLFERRRQMENAGPRRNIIHIDPFADTVFEEPAFDRLATPPSDVPPPEIEQEIRLEAADMPPGFAPPRPPPPQLNPMMTLLPLLLQGGKAGQGSPQQQRPQQQRQQQGGKGGAPTGGKGGQ